MNDEDNGWPPPRTNPSDDAWGAVPNVRERTGGRIPIVCADIVDMAYSSAGINLHKRFAIFPPEAFPAEKPERHSGALFMLLRDTQNLHWWDGVIMPELGDMIFFDDASHTGIVAEILGREETQIFIVQASYSQGVINKLSLSIWQQGHMPVSFGHIQ